MPTNQWFQPCFKVVRTDFVHPQYVWACLPGSFAGCEGQCDGKPLQGRRNHRVTPKKKGNRFLHLEAPGTKTKGKQLEVPQFEMHLLVCLCVCV